MADQVIQRRLAAILAADVAGYTRLMEMDTDGTVAAWQAARANVIKPIVTEYAGKIVKLTGDGFLVEFPTVQDAVNCVIALQNGLVSNSLKFRMGINLGDIVDDGEDIHGEGVNIAARLEGLAKPGGICISGGVYDQVRNRIEVAYKDMGAQAVKHFSAPVRVYGIDIGASKAEDGPLELPDVPSIAVLPFDNLSGDADQEPFADGMTEDLITDLSKVSGLFVVARNSSFAYKAKTIDIRTVASELGVRYVLEGSIRRSGDRVRINAQLIDAISGGHMWADRYDGSVENVFELQDEVGAKVVSALSVRLSPREADNLKRIHTKNLDAYELFVRARSTPYPPIPERIKSARDMFERVIEMDPDFAGGYAGFSFMLSFGAIWSHEDQSEIIDLAFKMAQRAISVDETFGWSYTALAMALLHQQQYEEAVAAARQAVDRQPNDADAHAFLGLIQGLASHYGDGISSINQAIRLNPQFVYGPYLNQLGQTHMLAGDYGAAAETYEHNVRRQGPIGPPALCWGAAAYAGLGRHDEAAKLTGRLRAEFPKFSMAKWNYIPLIHDAGTRERVVGLMRAAGVPGG